jgi:chromosome segregation ATPase
MLILLEQIQEQNRTTIEAIYSETRRLEKQLGDRFDRLEARVDNLELAVRFHTAELKPLQNSVLELGRDFAQFQEKIERSREEVAALDRRISSLESRLLP